MSSLHLPQHGLNIDRASLPQVEPKDVPDYLRWLSIRKHMSSIHTEMPVSALYPSQGNFNTTKIKALMTKEISNLRKPIIVSADHYVMDGHHRWIALLNLDPMGTIPVILVHAQALDLIAATKEYPKATTKTVVESFRTIMEESEKHAVLAYGRMNPPTTGHAKLVDKVHEVAKAHDAHHVVVLSHSQDEKKNPLSQSQKVKHAKRFFPKTNIEGATKENPTIFHHAAKLHKAGYTHLHVVAGADRVKEFSDNLNKYNGKFDKEGHGYHFKSIHVHSAGERDPDSEGTEGMSASKMREHAHKGNFKEFKKGIPSHVSHEHAKALYHDVRKGMGHLNEGFGHDRSPIKGIHYLQSKPKPYYDTLLGKWIYPKGSSDPKKDDNELKEAIDTMDAMPEKRGKFPVSTSQKANPQCQKCGGSGYERKYHSYGTHTSMPCQCTIKKDLKEEFLSEEVHDAGIFKAVFLAGAPGSGKDFVLKKALHGHGLTEINSDHALDHLEDKHKLDKKMPEAEQEKRGVLRSKAKSLTELRQRLALQGRNGLIINSTGASHDKIKKIKDHLDNLGYDSKMVFVDTSDNVSRNRNVERGQRGGRVIPEKARAQKWREAQDARVKFHKMFGGEHYHEFNNDEDLRHNADPEVATQKSKELDDLHKTVRKFTQQPPKSDSAQEWIYKNLGKLAKEPIGNKKQQASATPPSQDLGAADDAKKAGLQYYGKGRYGKGGRVTHFSLNGKLVEKKKALTPPKSLQANTKPEQPKKLNEAFENFIQEERDHVDLRLSDYLDSHLLVGESKVQSEPRPIKEFMQEWMLAVSPGSSNGRTEDGCVGLSRLRDRLRPGAQEVYQEGQKESLQAFKKRLVTEGEPTFDPGEEGGSPLGMGTGEKETLDMGKNGSVTKITKKTFSDLRKKK